MATPNRFAIRDCGTATFFSIATGKALVTLRTLKTSGVETSGTTTYARGGLGNAKLVGFSSNREAKMTLEDAIFDTQAIAMLTGNTLTKGVTIVDKNETQKVVSNSLSLSKTPIGALISVYKVNIDGSNGAEYTLGTPATSPAKFFSIAGKVLTFFAGAEPDNTTFRIYYKVNTDATASQMKVTTDAFGGTFRVTLDVVVRDEFTQTDYAGQYNIAVAKFEDNFKMDLKAEGDPASLSLPMEILKNPLSTDMWSLTIYDESLVL